MGADAITGYLAIGHQEEWDEEAINAQAEQEVKEYKDERKRLRDQRQAD